MASLTLHGQPVVDEAGFRQALQTKVRGAVHFDGLTRGVYATDASFYQWVPRCVVLPLDANDVVQAVQVAAKFGVPVTARGGGTSLSGQATWAGMVIDVSKHMAGVLSLDAETQTATVQPGVVRDALNKQAKAHGLHFAPDPATTSRCTIGGMVGNNSSGTRSIVHGKTSDHVLSLKVAMADGSVWVLGQGREDDPSTPEGAFAQWLRDTVMPHADAVLQRFPNLMRNVSGYALDALVKQWQALAADKQTRGFSLVPLFVGSEGTLGVVLEATVKLTPLPRHTALCLGLFASSMDALKATEAVVAHGPSAVELLDDVVLNEAARNPSTKHLAASLYAGQQIGDGDSPQGMLICEFSADTAGDAAAQVERLAEAMLAKGVGLAWPCQLDKQAIANVWSVRQLGLGLISNTPGPVKGQAFIEDACVPLKHLPDYIQFVLDVCESKGVPISIYAHASVGVIHCRPMLDLHKQADVDKMVGIAEACFEKVVELGGSFSSEHGDGLVRGQFVRRFYGDTINGLFEEIKTKLDPTCIMNPGKKVWPGSMTDNLRQTLAAQNPPVGMATCFDDGRLEGGQGLGMLEAVEQCNGVGACRKIDAGTMCPSYMATKDETHSTRGRANALRLALSGQLEGMQATDAMASDALHDALSLCLSCKACATECPNGVDMAKHKAEALQMRHDRKGVPLEARLIGALPTLAKWGAGPMAKWLNAWAGKPWLQRQSKRWLKLDVSHGVPKLAEQAWPDKGVHPKKTLSSQRPEVFASGGSGGGLTSGGVVLFADTYARFFEGGLGPKAVALIESLGVSVQVVTPGCCQRPAISQGLLRQAKAKGLQTLEGLRPWLLAQVPVLVIEPSCFSALTDDLPALVRGADADLARHAKSGICLLDDWLLETLQKRQAAGHAPVWHSEVEALCVHAHCHQKAMTPEPAFAKLLSAAGARVRVADAGCCGMAGAFGHQHADVAGQVMDNCVRRLGVEVAAANDEAAEARSATGETVAVSGFSCELQLSDRAGLPTRHWLDLLTVG